MRNPSFLLAICWTRSLLIPRSVAILFIDTSGLRRMRQRTLLMFSDSDYFQGSTPMTDAQVKALFLVNALPFIGFGFLDNMIMIIAGNYIDQELGALLCLSTMAAAGLGNLISDVAGVGLAHYVEGVFYKMGIKHPVLSAEQLGSSRARWTTNGARAFGLTIGCIVGMFPLLFFNTDGEGKAEAKAKTSQ
ncbi:unnamed protein product [Heligmosomoides polygyrus]|uniref:Transmembrane protein 65 n=1 Tax=Heligmosomoides polygyrus TaxID=6339 RepID=A0A3P8AYI8_HELPZ|nr:unnamed protein product [Heligmosomoides polygyrus]